MAKKEHPVIELPGGLIYESIETIGFVAVENFYLENEAKKALTNFLRACRNLETIMILTSGCTKGASSLIEILNDIDDDWRERFDVKLVTAHGGGSMILKVIDKATTAKLDFWTENWGDSEILDDEEMVNDALFEIFMECDVVVAHCYDGVRFRIMGSEDKVLEYARGLKKPVLELWKDGATHSVRWYTTPPSSGTSDPIVYEKADEKAA